jgi:hypothetical protein
VKIQQDGASPHTGLNNNNRIARFGSTGGWKFNVFNQPAQSPDLNILDLGLFHSLKCMVGSIKQRADNIDGMIIKVKLAYSNYDYKTLDHIWAHLFAVYNAILQDNGGNQYKAPHSGVRKNAQIGSSSVNLTIDLDNYNRHYVALGR